jgi:predicted MPP superfamily phosphohydrolase
MSPIAMIMRFGMLFLIIFLLDLYVFQGLKQITKQLPYKNYLHIAYWLLSVLIICLFVFNFFVVPRNVGINSAMVRFVIGAIILLTVPKLVVTLFLVAEDLFRLLSVGYYFITHLIKPTSVDNLEMPDRRKFISQLALLTAAIPFGAIVYGIAKGRYNFQLRELSINFKNLPKAFDGLTITQISDIHIGSFSSGADIQKGIDVIKNANSDLVLFTGDLVNNVATEVTPWKHLLSQITAPMGVYSVLGNHDYADYIAWESKEAKENNMQDLYNHHAEAGFKLLKNEHHILERGTDKIAIVGIENWGLPPFPQHGNLDKATHGLAESMFKVLLSHDPSHWEAEAVLHPSNISLALAGHTHGMQFGIDIPGWRWSPVKFKYPKWIDLYKTGEKYLYVNRGFGFLAFPGRVGVMPEITKITLRSV